MDEYIKKNTALKTIFDSVGKPATEIYQAVRDLPAEDVVERSTAYWEWEPICAGQESGEWRCGKCRRTPQTWWNKLQACYPTKNPGGNYCGFCGAKMGDAP